MRQLVQDQLRALRALPSAASATGNHAIGHGHATGRLHGLADIFQAAHMVVLREWIWNADHHLIESEALAGDFENVLRSLFEVLRK